MATSTAPSLPNDGISDVQGEATHCVANHLAHVRLPVWFALFVFLASPFLGGSCSCSHHVTPWRPQPRQLTVAASKVWWRPSTRNTWHAYGCCLGCEVTSIFVFVWNELYLQFMWLSHTTRTTAGTPCKVVAHHIFGCLSVDFAAQSVLCCRGQWCFGGGRSQGGVHGLVIFVTYLRTPGMEK